MFGFTEECYKKYDEEYEKQYEFPLGIFDWQIIRVLPNIISKYGKRQTEITFKISGNGYNFEKKDWFLSEPNMMWKWATLIKSCNFKEKVDIKTLNINLLLGRTGKIEGTDSVSKTKFDDSGNPVISRTARYLPQTNKVEEAQPVLQLKEPLDVPF